MAKLLKEIVDDQRRTRQDAEETYFTLVIAGDDAPEGAGLDLREAMERLGKTNADVERDIATAQEIRKTIAAAAEQTETLAASFAANAAFAAGHSTLSARIRALEEEVRVLRGEKYRCRQAYDNAREAGDRLKVLREHGSPMFLAIEAAMSAEARRVDEFNAAQAAEKERRRLEALEADRQAAEKFEAEQKKVREVNRRNWQGDHRYRDDLAKINAQDAKPAAPAEVTEAAPHPLAPAHVPSVLAPPEPESEPTPPVATNHGRRK